MLSEWSFYNPYYENTLASPDSFIYSAFATLRWEKVTQKV